MGCCEQLPRRLLMASLQRVMCMSQACAGNQSFGMRFISTCLPSSGPCPAPVAAARSHRLVCLRVLSTSSSAHRSHGCLRLIRAVQGRQMLSVICSKRLHNMPVACSVTGPGRHGPGGSVHTLDNVNDRGRTFLSGLNKCDGTTLSSLCSAIVRKKSTKAGKTFAREDIEDDEVCVITLKVWQVARWTVKVSIEKLSIRKQTPDSNPNTYSIQIQALYSNPNPQIRLKSNPSLDSNPNLRFESEPSI